MKKRTNRQKNQLVDNSRELPTKVKKSGLKKSLPTKAELLSGDIVTIDSKHKSITANTLKIADYFGKRPSNVNQLINALIKKGRLIIKPSYYLNEQNKEQKYYELDRQQFAQVVLGFTGDAAEQFRYDYTMEFERKDAECIEWRKGRLLSIDATKSNNDAVFNLRKKLVQQYPSRKTGSFAFNNIRGAICKAATGDYRLKRDDMTCNQLKAVTALEMEVNALIDNHDNDDSMMVYMDVIAFLRLGV